MNTEVIENQLVAVAEQSGLATESAQHLLASFQPHFANAQDLCEQAKGVVVTDATQVTEIKKSRALRLKLKDVRVEAEKTRKALKEDSMRTGKAIDGMANVLKYLIEPVEQRLEDQEKIAERMEAERKAALKASREELLRPYGIDTTGYLLGDMTEATFAQLLDSARLAHAARIEAEKKAEADRIAVEAARVAEEQRIKAENERLRKEAEAREKRAAAERKKAADALAAEQEKARKEKDAIEAKARKEREAAEAAARKEREAREKLEAEAAARKRADDAKAAADAKAKKAAALAPDKDKVASLSKTVRGIAMPDVKSPEARVVVQNISIYFEKLAAFIEQQAERIA